MEFAFKTIQEFNDYFKDDKTCYAFLENQRWGTGTPVCPHCGITKKPYKVTPRGKFKDAPTYRCSDRQCGLPFTVLTNSIFEGTKVELRKWFQAAYELSTAKKGISSVELGIRIGVSQKTAWFINHRLRVMLSQTAPTILKGNVQVDETYVGGKNKNRHADKKVKKSQGRSSKDKTPVFGILATDTKQVQTTVVPNTKASTLQPIMVKSVAKGSIIVSDEWRAYRGLKIDYTHVVLNHNAKQYVKDGYHTNSLEGFWSLLKRGIIGTFHFVSPQHLHRYCNEFSYRYNNKDISNIARFNDSLKNADNKRLTYKILTSGSTKFTSKVQI